MATAELITGDPSLNPEFVETERGASGTRHYRVNKRAVDGLADVMAATGLPKLGDAWSTAYPLVLARTRRVRDHEGTDDPATGEDNWAPGSIVRVEYASDVGGGVPTPPRQGESYAEVRGQVASITARFGLEVFQQDAAGGLTPAPGLELEPVGEGGFGVSADVGTLLVRVVFYPASGGALDLASVRPFLRLQGLQAVNADPVALPPFRWQGAGAGWVLAPGEARYHLFEIETVGEGGLDTLGRPLVRHVHTLLLGEDHLTRYRREDQKGNAVDPTYAARLYPAEPWPALV